MEIPAPRTSANSWKISGTSPSAGSITVAFSTTHRLGQDLEHIDGAQHVLGQIQVDPARAGRRTGRERIIAVGDQHLGAMAAAAQRLEDFGMQQFVLSIDSFLRVDSGRVKRRAVRPRQPK
jgi:hypothetical protein